MSRGALEYRLQILSSFLTKIWTDSGQLTLELWWHSNCLQKSKRWGTYCPMIFKVLDHLENLTPVWKYVQVERPSVFCLNNLERLSFVKCLHTKVLLLHCPRYDFAIFGYIYLNVNYFLTIIWKEKENKVNRKDLRGCHFVSTIVKHPLCERVCVCVYIYIYIYDIINV